MNLLNKTPEELRNMSKQDVHEGYKKIIKQMLLDFYFDVSNEDYLETVADLREFIDDWIHANIKDAQPDWKPGDQGK